MNSSASWMLPASAYEVPSQLPPSAASQHTLSRGTPAVLAPATRLAVPPLLSSCAITAASPPGVEVYRASSAASVSGVCLSPPPPSITVPALSAVSTGTVAGTTPLSALAMASAAAAPFMASYVLASPPPGASSWGDVDLGCLTSCDSPTTSSTISSGTRHRASTTTTNNNNNTVVAGAATPASTSGHTAAPSTTAMQTTATGWPTALQPRGPSSTPLVSPSWWAATAGSSEATTATTATTATPHLVALPHAPVPAGGLSTPSTPATSPSTSQQVVFVQLDLRNASAASAGHEGVVTPGTHHLTEASPMPGLTGGLAFFPVAPTESANSTSLSHLPMAVSTTTTMSAVPAARGTTPTNHLAYMTSPVGSPLPEVSDVFVPISASFPMTGLTPASAASSVTSRVRAGTPVASALGPTHTCVPCTAVRADDVEWCSICHCANTPVIDSEADADEDSTHAHGDALLRRSTSSTASTARTLSRASSTVVASEGVRGGSPMVRLVCTHTFHANCIQRWLLRETTCPICRRDVAPTAASAAHLPHTAGMAVRYMPALAQPH